MKSNRTPSAYASAQISTASCPLVRNRRPGGSPVARDTTGSLACSRGIHCRAPISACQSEEHTSELQSRGHLVCRLLLEKKKKLYINNHLLIKIKNHIKYIRVK